MLKRLIEVALPLKEVSEQSAREKSIRHGHISTLHIWWARRPLAACRAVVFASLIPDPDDPACPESFRKLVREILGRNEFRPKSWEGTTVPDTPRSRCLEFIKSLVRWENSNNPEYIEPARRLIAGAHKLLHPEAKDDTPKVLDPFAGGGAIPLEALRLGCDAHAIDLNPVAHLIELCTLVYPQKYGRPDSRPVPEYIKRLIAHNKTRKKAKGEVGLFDNDVEDGLADEDAVPNVDITEAEYRKNPLASDVEYWGYWILARARAAVGSLYGTESSGLQPLAFLWTRTVRCPNPNCGAEVPLLQTRAVAVRRNSSISITQKVTRKGLVFGIKHNDSIQSEDVAGTMSRTSAACPLCNTVILKTDLETIGKRSGFGERIACVVEPSAEGRNTYRPPAQEDFALTEEAQRRLASQDQSLLPTESLPYLRSIFNVHVYGLDRWFKLFNGRQLLTMVTLLRQARHAGDALAKYHGLDYANAITAFLALALGRQADYLTTLCTWTPDGEFVGHTFGRQALPMVWDYAEVNPFADASGNWRGALDWICRVVKRISDARMPPGDVQRGEATRLPYEPNSLDCVITDPPYYDAVPYADLSDFFYVWQRRLLSPRFPAVFVTPLTPKAAELVQLAGRNDVYQNKTKVFFERGMQPGLTPQGRSY
jgi:putative DNA methylase